MLTHKSMNAQPSESSRKDAFLNEDDGQENLVEEESKLELRNRLAGNGELGNGKAIDGELCDR